MSRIGRMPIKIPSGVDVSLKDRTITVKGPKGTLEREIPNPIEVEVSNGEILCKRPSDDRRVRALHGLTRALIDNMVTGVSQGFTKELLVIGVGYKVEEKGQNLVFHLGYSHPIEFPLPKGIKATVERQKEIKVRLEGTDKEVLGLVASKIRSLRPPEPYKGKGIQYVDETIIRKAGKAGAK